MNVIFDTERRAFLTIEGGWTTVNKDGALEGLEEVARFTRKERDNIYLSPPQEWREYGSFLTFKELTKKVSKT